MAPTFLLAPLLLAQVKAPGTTLPNPVQQTVTELTDLSKACQPDDSVVCQKVYEWTGSAWWAGAAEWFVAKPLKIAGIVLAAWVVNRLARWFIRRSLERMAGSGTGRTVGWLREKSPDALLRTDAARLRSEARLQTLSTVFRGVATAVIWFIALVWILEVLEVNLGPIIASAGIIGVALGFGAQYMVRDFLAGLFLVIEDQFGVGDIVDLGPDAKGTVEKVTLRVTRIRDVNGVVWHVPNGQIMRVGNKSQEWARAVLDIEVGYDADLDLVQDLIQRTADALAADPDWSGMILETPEVWGVETFTPTGVSIRLVLKTQPASQFGVMRELRARLKAAFDDSGIDFPAARNDVFVHAVPEAADGRGPGEAAAAPDGERSSEVDGEPPGAEPGVTRPRRARGAPDETG